MIIEAKPYHAINLGRVGENIVRIIKFDVADIKTDYPSATFAVLNQRPSDLDAYPVDPSYYEVSDNYLLWTVQSGDLAYAGTGECQIVASLNSAVVKTDIYTTFVGRSLDDSATPPEPWESWVNDVVEAKEDAETAAESAEEAKDAVLNMTVSAEGLAAGSDPTATYEDGHMTFGIPSGETPEFSIGTVTTGDAGTNAAVTKTGTDLAPVLNFTIPKGAKGDAGNGDMLAPAFVEATPNDPGTYVTYNGAFYYLPNGHEANVTWANTTKTSTTVGGQLSEQKSALTAYVGNLVNDFTWMSGKSFNLSTGAIKTQSGFNATYRVLGSDFTEQFNYESISGSSSNFVAMWLNGTYVGYYWRAKYYNPSSTEITKPNYNEWALSAGDSSASSYHLYTIAYQRQITALKAETQDLYEITQPLVDEFTWSNGYYSFTTGNPDGATTQYHRTNKMQGSQYIFADSAVFDGSSYNFISLWYQGTYAGYYLDGKYYNPSRTQVESITYDEWATNIYTNNYAQLKPNSLGNRVTNLESREQPSPLQGKKLGCIGDSIAAGAGFLGGYGGIIANDYGMTIDNNAANGSVLVPQQSYSTIIPQLNSLDNDCDYVILEGGFNDSWLASPIGVYSDSYAEPTTDDTFYGNLNYLLYTAVHKYAGKKVCYLIVHAGKTEYSCMIDTYPYYEATVKLCKKWGVPIVDLNKNCVPFGLLPTTDQIRTTYTANSGDGVHPNEAGYRKYYVPQIVAMLESI